MTIEEFLNFLGKEGFNLKSTEPAMGPQVTPNNAVYSLNGPEGQISITINSRDTVYPEINIKPLDREIVLLANILEANGVEYKNMKFNSYEDQYDYLVEIWSNIPRNFFRQCAEDFRKQR